MKTSESIKEFATAFSLAQAEMGGVLKNKENPAFKNNGVVSMYADLAAVVEAVKQPFCNHGLSYIQFPISNVEGMGCSTRIMHTSGEWIESEFTMPLGKVSAHGSGSNFTYARRYALSAACGLPVQDDDGNAASLAVEPFVGLNDIQYTSLNQMLGQNEFEVARFLHVYQIKHLNQLPSADFEDAMERVRIFGLKKAELAKEEKAPVKKAKVEA